MTAAWMATVPLLAEADVCVVGSGSAGSAAAMAAARTGAVATDGLRARLASDGAILDVPVRAAA